MPAKPKAKKRKTSVVGILKMHAEHEASAEHVSIGARLRQILDERGLKPMEFIKMTGMLKDTTAYQVMKNLAMTVGREKAALWERTLDLPPGTLPARQTQAAPPRKTAAHPRSNGAVPPINPKRTDMPDQFSLTIDVTGAATLRLNLERIPIEAALRTIQTLTNDGVLRLTNLNGGVAKTEPHAGATEEEA